MIQANELRIGNWVNTPDGYKVVNGIGTGWGMHFIWTNRMTNEGYGGHRCEPIPLTPEILEKCGFNNKSQTTDYWYEKGDFIIGGWRKTLYPSLPGESGLTAYGNELKYLHQLQNLTYALTGEELNIEL